MKRNLLNKLALLKGLFAFSKKFCYNNYRKSKKEDNKIMGNLFQQLPPHERGIMEAYISTYAPIEGNNEGNGASLEYRLRFWDEAKSEYLHKMLGGKLILEREIEYDASIEELVDRYEKKSGRLCRLFYTELYDKLYSAPEWKDLMFQNWDNSIRDCSGIFSYLNSHEVLMLNRWEAPEMRLPLPGGKNFKVAPGTKITRVLGRLAKAYNLNGWEEVRQAQADALTVKKTKGTLCLSIHPMDYMTMSDNLENWDSCMNWMNDGGYRGGTVEMMNSPCVVVAYLKHPTHKLEDCWNSKVWRELYIVTPTTIANVKAYPFLNSWLTKYILNWLRELAETSGVGVYEDSIKCLSAEGYSDDSEWFHENKININFITDTMYNDCGRVDQYYYLKKDIYDVNKTINYSGTRSCMICGEPYDFSDESNLLCEDCEYISSFQCSECGDWVCKEDAYEDDDGNYYCSECWHDIFTHPYDKPDYAIHYEDCDQMGLILPDQTKSTQTVYLYNSTALLKRINPELIWEDLPEDNDTGARYIPYNEADTDLKYACGYSFSEQVFGDIQCGIARTDADIDYATKCKNSLYKLFVH